MTRPKLDHATKWRAGDPVVVLPDMNKLGGGTFVVKSVGRKWLTLDARGRVRRFDIATGKEQGNGAGGYCYAVAPQEAKDLEIRALATKQLRNLTAHWNWHHVLSTEEMETICRIIELAHAERGTLK